MFAHCIFGGLATAVTVFPWDEVLLWAGLKNRMKGMILCCLWIFLQSADLNLCAGWGTFWSRSTAFERGEIDITFIFIQRKDKSAMVKYQLRPRQNCFIVLTDLRLFGTQSDVKTECMLTPVQQPEPELPQVTKTVMNRKACNIVTSVATCTGKCRYSKFILAFALWTLSDGFQLCFGLSFFVFIQEN